MTQATGALGGAALLGATASEGQKIGLQYNQVIF